MDLTDVTHDRALTSAGVSISRTPDRRLDRLTPRELEITRLISFGETSKSIGRALGISFRTVETHRARIIAKLGTRSRAELVLLTIGEWPEFARGALLNPEPRQGITPREEPAGSN